MFVHREFYCRRAIDLWGSDPEPEPEPEPEQQPEPDPEPEAEPEPEQIPEAEPGRQGDREERVFRPTEHLTVQCYADDAELREAQVRSPQL